MATVGGAKGSQYTPTQAGIGSGGGRLNVGQRWEGHRQAAGMGKHNAGMAGARCVGGGR